MQTVFYDLLLVFQITRKGRKYRKFRMFFL